MTVRGGSSVAWSGEPKAEPRAAQIKLVKNTNRLQSPRAALASVLALAAILLLGLTGPVRAASSRPAFAASDEGIAMGTNTGVLFNSHKFTRAQIDAQLAALARTGATTVRSDALWETAEPNPPTNGIQLFPPAVGLIRHYDWRHDDLIAGMLAAHGLRWLPIIDYTAAWDETVPGDDHSPPKSVSDYYTYAAAVAARYGPGGSFWSENSNLPPRPVDNYEIWNEPDSHYFWHPTPDPAAYADLYASARAAILTVEPTARVIIGGLTSPPVFLASLLNAAPRIRGQIDGVAIHPYGPTPEHVLDSVRTDRLAMNADGMSTVPLYVTEFGWTTHPKGAHDWAPPEKRPGYIWQTLAGLGHTDCGIAAVLLYAWATPQRQPGDGEDWYGISPPDASASPDTAAFTGGVHAASAGPLKPLCSGPSPLAAAHKVSAKRSHHAHKHPHRSHSRHPQHPRRQARR